MPSGAPGHEAWGIVTEVAAAADEHLLGRRVAMLSGAGYASYVAVDHNELVVLPDELEDQAFPGEAFGCIFNILNRAEVQPNTRVAVVGCGFIGLGLISQLALQGIKVTGFSRSTSSLKHAEAFGATSTIPLDDHEGVIQQAKDATEGSFYDVVFECTGKEWPLQLASELTGVRKKLVIAGYHQDGMRSLNVQLWNWRGIDIINSHERDVDVYKNGIEAAAQKAVEEGNPLLRLITHCYSLDEIDKAFQDLANQPDDYIKGVVLNR